MDRCITVLLDLIESRGSVGIHAKKLVVVGNVGVQYFDLGSWEYNFGFSHT